MAKHGATVLLDLDRTLFDTDKFIRTVWPWLERTYMINALAAREEMQTYSHYVDDMYNYDFFAHIAALGLDGEDLCARAPAEITDAFIYDDALAFLEQTKDLEREILTFGNESYQLFKLSFCPALRSLPVHTTLHHKKDYIHDHWADQPTIMIDDRLLAGTLPASSRFIHVDRTQEQPVIEHEQYMSVRTLTDINKEWLV